MSASSVRELALTFDCRGERLVGIVSLPAAPADAQPVSTRRGATGATPGVLIVVGGPQYRAGSHRQFTLMCRALAECGIPAMRFDCRGMGDSEGAPRTFEEIDADIAAATDHFFATVPDLRAIAILGLCDGASAAMFRAHRDPRVTGLVLVNPWARTEAGLAKTQLRHYYAGRLADGEFWRRLVRGEVDVGAALRSAAGAIRTAAGHGAAGDGDGDRKPDAGDAFAQAATTARSAMHSASLPLPERMAASLSRFEGRVLLVLSGNDLTAKEFRDAAGSSPAWRKLLAGPRIETRELPDADHTFSRAEWRERIVAWTTAWAAA